jgi:hypothetical protein
MPKHKLTDEEKKIRKEKMERKALLQRRDNALKSSLKDCKNAIARGSVGNPTYFFKTGDRVTWGAWDKVIVLKSFDNGMYYLCIRVGWNVEYGITKGIKKNMDYCLWPEIRPYRTKEELEKNPRVEEDDDIFFQYGQRDIQSILFQMYGGAGISLTPDYQRDLVWTEEQKISLIDSIFKNIDIGKFTIIRRKYKEGQLNHYEVLDGKQRIQALLDFYECRFKYKGLIYNDMHWRDRNHFKSYSINWAETEPLTDEQKYRYFLKLNVSGVPIPKEHLDKVRKMWLDVQTKKLKG